MKRKFIALSWCIVLAACQPVTTSEIEKRTALALASQSATETIPSISPDQLKIGPVNAPLCAKPMTVIDPEVACKKNNCSVKAFYSELMPVQKNQRAIRVSACGDEPTPTHLLTEREPRFNSTAILILQNERDGENLWRQLQEGDQYQIEFATEAAEGVLSLNPQGQYEWAELPD